MAAEDDTGFLSRWSRRKVAQRQGAVPLDPADPPAPELKDEPPPAPAQPHVAMAPAGAVAMAPAGAVAMAPAGAVARPTAAERPAAPTATAPAEAAAIEPAPTLADAARLTPASDFRRFVAPGVDSQVRNAALKTLFSDPQFNVMDGLDTYIDDYGKPDPLPLGMLRQMAQGKFLGLFADDADAPANPTAAGAGSTAGAGTADATAPSAAPSAAPASAAAALTLPPMADSNDLSSPPDEDPNLRLQPHDAAGRQGPEPGAGQDAGRQRRGA